MKFSSKLTLTIVALLLVVLANTSIVDQRSQDYTEAGLKRTLVTFGVSRGLNGVISVMQGTEVAVEPVGIGMTFTPGQILDPVNDLVERFSTVVLYAGTAFGVQRVLLDVSSAKLLSIVFSVLVLAAILMLWWQHPRFNQIKPYLYKTVLVMVILRFAIPVTAIGSELFYQYFLQPQYMQSTQQLSATTDQLQQMEQDSSIDQQATEKDKSFLQSARDMMRSASSTLDIREKIKQFKTAAENISEHAIKLMVVFVIQTILLPILSLWGVLQLLKLVVRPRTANSN